MGGIMRRINQIVVHCSATPDYMDIGASTINKWHVERGWSGIGYHYIIRRNGEIEKGRPDVQVGAHARGANSNSIAICWVGQDSISPEQEKALFSLIHFLMGKYSVDIDKVQGHNEAVNTSKTCPNLDMNRVRAELIFVQPKPKVR